MHVDRPEIRLGGASPIGGREPSLRVRAIARLVQLALRAGDLRAGDGRRDRLHRHRGDLRLELRDPRSQSFDLRLACLRLGLRVRQLLLGLGDRDLRLAARGLARGKLSRDRGELRDPRLAVGDRRLLADRLRREAVLPLARAGEHQLERADALLGVPDLLDRLEAAGLIRRCEDLQLRAKFCQACCQAVVARRWRLHRAAVARLADVVGSFVHPASNPNPLLGLRQPPEDH